MIRTEGEDGVKRDKLTEREREGMKWVAVSRYWAVDALILH